MIANKVLVFNNQVFRITAMMQRLISPLDNCKTPFRLPLVVNCYLGNQTQVYFQYRTVCYAFNWTGSVLFYHFMVSNFKSILVNSIALFVAIFSDTLNLEETTCQPNRQTLLWLSNRTKWTIAVVLEVLRVGGNWKRKVVLVQFLTRLILACIQFHTGTSSMRLGRE